MKFELRSLIAQTLLKEDGFYHGALDGLWGPMSTDAAEAWEVAQLRTAIPPADGTTPYDLALRHLGENEIPGTRHNPLIVRWHRIIATWINDDETPWCSSFVNAMALEAGFEHTGKLNARSWLDIGERIHSRDARQGDVVIFWRNSPHSWEGHVAFVHEWRPGSTTIRVLGGNQRNAVTIESYPVSQVIGFRRLRSLDALQGNTASMV